MTMDVEILRDRTHMALRWVAMGHQKGTVRRSALDALIEKICMPGVAFGPSADGTLSVRLLVRQGEAACHADGEESHIFLGRGRGRAVENRENHPDCDLFNSSQEVSFEQVRWALSGRLHQPDLVSDIAYILVAMDEAKTCNLAFRIAD